MEMDIKLLIGTSFHGSFSSLDCRYSEVNDTDVRGERGRGARAIEKYAVPGASSFFFLYPGNSRKDRDNEFQPTVTHARTPRRAEYSTDPPNGNVAANGGRARRASPRREAWRRRHVLIPEFVEARGHEDEKGGEVALSVPRSLPRAHERKRERRPASPRGRRKTLLQEPLTAHHLTHARAIMPGKVSNVGVAWATASRETLRSYSFFSFSVSRNNERGPRVAHASREGNRRRTKYRDEGSRRGPT